MLTTKQYGAADNDYDQDNWIDETLESEGQRFKEKLRLFVIRMNAIILTN
ncbi:hypothetical protein ACXM2N_09400 [Corynebacterium sp. ZY180755]